MVNITQTNYEEYTDKYFLRSKKILQAEGINPIVRYQVFARKDLDHIAGINEAVDFIRRVSGNKVKIYSLREGDYYNAKEPIFKLEARVQDLVDLETIYLGILSGNITPPIDMAEVRKKASAIVKAAQGKPVDYFGARHFHPSLDEQIARICFEEGFRGASTDIGARARNLKGGGTTPHALILSYAAYMQENGINGNPTVEVAKAFDRNMDKSIPRIILIDTFNREIYDSIASAREVSDLAGVRIDTCGENYAEGTGMLHDEETGLLIDDGKDYQYKGYWNQKGVSIAAVWALRRGLDKAGYGDKKIIVSSGFNEEKTGVFLEADSFYKGKYGKSLFDFIGTGSIAKPIMTTSDIVAYYSEKQGKWIPLSKKGREEKPSTRLEEVK